MVGAGVTPVENRSCLRGRLGFFGALFSVLRLLLETLVLKEIMWIGFVSQVAIERSAKPVLGVQWTRSVPVRPVHPGRWWILRTCMELWAASSGWASRSSQRMPRPGSPEKGQTVFSSFLFFL